MTYLYRFSPITHAPQVRPMWVMQAINITLDIASLEGALGTQMGPKKLAYNCI